MGRFKLKKIFRIVRGGTAIFSASTSLLFGQYQLNCEIDRILVTHRPQEVHSHSATNHQAHSHSPVKDKKSSEESDSCCNEVGFFHGELNSNSSYFCVARAISFASIFSLIDTKGFFQTSSFQHSQLAFSGLPPPTENSPIHIRFTVLRI